MCIDYIYYSRCQKWWYKIIKYECLLYLPAQIIILRLRVLSTAKIKIIIIFQNQIYQQISILSIEQTSYNIKYYNNIIYTEFMNIYNFFFLNITSK